VGAVPTFVARVAVVVVAEDTFDIAAISALSCPGVQGQYWLHRSSSDSDSDTVATLTSGPIAFAALMSAG
jgi:hypothetical protein